MPLNTAELRDTRYLLKNVFPGSALPEISHIQAALGELYEINELRTIGGDYARTLTEWKARLTARRNEVVRRWGTALFEHYVTYFDAAKRSFEAGVVDLAQISLRRKEPAPRYLT